MSNPPPIVNATITCHNCQRTQTRTFRAQPGDTVVLRCERCGARMTLVLER